MKVVWSPSKVPGIRPNSSCRSSDHMSFWVARSNSQWPIRHSRCACNSLRWVWRKSARLLAWTCCAFSSAIWVRWVWPSSISRSFSRRCNASAMRLKFSAIRKNSPPGSSVSSATRTSSWPCSSWRVTANILAAGSTMARPAIRQASQLPSNAISTSASDTSIKRRYTGATTSFQSALTAMKNGASGDCVLG